MFFPFYPDDGIWGLWANSRADSWIISRPRLPAERSPQETERYPGGFHKVQLSKQPNHYGAASTRSEGSFSNMGRNGCALLIYELKIVRVPNKLFFSILK